MEKAQSFLLWPIALTVFGAVLFADLFPLPLDSYASQRFLLAGLLMLVCIPAGAIWLARSDWQGIKQFWPTLLVASGFLLLALPFQDRPYAWVEPGMYALYFLGFGLAGNLAGSHLQRKQSVTVLVYVGAATAALYGAIAFLTYLFALSDQVVNLSKFIPWGFVNIRYWSHVATWLIPLLALAPLVGPFREQRLWRFMCALTAALWWWVVFLSSSRGTMLGLVFGFFLVLLLIGRPALPWLKVFVRYFAYGLLAWLLLSVIVPSLVSTEVGFRKLHTGSSARIIMFLEAWRMSLENFPFGMGPQSWLTHEIMTDEYLKHSKFAHPHNMYLMWAAEYGWLMILALLGLVGQGIRLFWRRRAQVRADQESEMALPLAAFTASVSAALLHAGVSSVFIAPGSMLVGFLVLCVFWGLIVPDQEVMPQWSGKRVSIAVSVAVLLGVLSSLWLREVMVYHQAMEQDRNDRYGENVYGTPPRFWHYGYFPNSTSPKK